MTPVVIVVIAVVVVVAVAVVFVSRRRPSDGVSSFQRQIDALSPEARRTVVDQVHNVQIGDRDDSAPSDGDEGEPDADDEGAADGT